MDFALQPDFALWIEGEAAALPGLVDDLTELAVAARPASGGPHERAVVNIPESDIIGEIIQSQTDVYGRLVTRFFPEEGRVLGLTGDKLVEVLKFAERISSRKELQNIISSDTIREMVLEWIAATVRHRPTDPLITKITQTVRNKVRPLDIWIPIEETQVAGELLFADATLKMVSRTEFDVLVERGFRSAPAEAARLTKEKLHRAWLGRAAMCFSFVAEPKRAHELALEKAENYMALLQFYGAAPLVLRLTSYSAPFGARPRQTYRSIAFEQQSVVSISEGVVGTTTWIQFTTEGMNDINLQVLSSLGLGAACDYEDALRASLLVYGRACYHVDPVDKLLQIITAVEMFTLRDDNEPISGNVADRIAFAIAKGVEHRQSIVKNFKQVYGIRSKKTHHGRDIAEITEIEIFLENVWRFFHAAIRAVGRYQTRIAFLDDLDRVKYT